MLSAAAAAAVLRTLRISKTIFCWVDEGVAAVDPFFVG
jgi:hypothetical protein